MQDWGQKIFFSYARSDSKFALELAEDMRSAGLDLWIDRTDIPSGAPWDRTVEDALKNCPSFLVILSPVSVASQNVMNEVSLAIRRNKRILPILYQSCEIPLLLERSNFIDFTNDYVEGRAKLLRELNASIPIGRSESSSPKPSVAQGSANKRGLIVALLIAAAIGILGGLLIANRDRLFLSGCTAEAVYPLGRWDVEVPEAKAGDYTPFVIFETQQSGTWGQKDGTFMASDKLAPGKGTTLTFSAPNDPDRSKDTLRISADGCSMAGQFRTNQQPATTGNVTYTWRGGNSVKP